MYLIHRRSEFRADEITVEKLKKAKNLELVLDSVAVEVLGDKFVKGLVVQNLKTSQKTTLQLNGVFIQE